MGWIAAFVFAAALACLGGAMWLLVDPKLRARTLEAQSAVATDAPSK
jgi:hypothetical protein